MTRALKILAVVLAACLVQTNLAGAFRFQGVAPDFMIAALVAMSEVYGTYGGICSGMLMGLLYDSTVGYALALDLIAYAAVGYFAPMMYGRLVHPQNTVRRRRLPVMAGICFIMAMTREIADIGYLFLIGAEQGWITVFRALIGAGMTTLAFFPSVFLVRRFFAPKRRPEDETDL